MFSNLFNFQNKQKDGNEAANHATSANAGTKTELKSKLSLGFKNKDKNKKQQQPQQAEIPVQPPVQVSLFFNEFC